MQTLTEPRGVRVSEPLELGRQVVVSCPVWVLGVNLRSLGLALILKHFFRGQDSG